MRIPPDLNWRRARLFRDKRAVVAVISALMAMPMLISVGTAVDLGTLAHDQQLLQDAVDAAALAGASVYTTQGAAVLARQTAQENFAYNTRNLPNGPISPDISFPVGPSFNNLNSYTIKVTANGQFGVPMISAMLGVSQTNVTAIATQPQVTVSTPADRAPVPKAYEGDWDTVYMYQMRADALGQTDVSQNPAIVVGNDQTMVANGTTVVEVSSNCNAYFPLYVPNVSACIGQPGSLASGPRTMTVGANQQIGFALQDVTWDLTTQIPLGSTNSYNSTNGESTVFLSTLLAGGMTPSLYANAGAGGPRGTTFSSQQNCTLQIALSAGSFAMPPAPGVCTPPVDPAVGSQFGSFSCSQIGHRTYNFYWNDGGNGPDSRTDDRNYQDMQHAVACDNTQNSVVLVE